MSWPSQDYPVRADGTFGPSRGHAPLAVVTALLAAAGTVVGLFFYQQRATAMGEVPAIVGMPVAQARRLLKQRGFSLTVRDRRSDGLVARGAVASQSPLARQRLARGGGVAVVLSTGPASPKSKPIPPNPTKVGAAVNRKPAAKASAEPATKKAGVAVPPPGKGGVVAVPKVAGVRLSYARGRLRTLGLKVGRIRHRLDEDHMNGLVLKQEPKPGSKVAPGTAIDLVVNRLE